MRFGFIGRSGDFRKESDLLLLSEALEVNHLLLPKQVHGNTVAVVDTPTIEIGEADALLFVTSTRIKHDALIGVKTADCLPILVLSDSFTGVIHAGWRGLANGIIKNFIKLRHSLIASKEKELYIIGPAICETCYEVKEPVIREIEEAVYRQSDEKLYLNLRKTAEIQLTGKRVIHLEICTKCQRDEYPFHSHRSDGSEKRGLNLGFVCV
jgi:hypothetical protein